MWNKKWILCERIIRAEFISVEKAKKVIVKSIRLKKLKQL